MQPGVWDEHVYREREMLLLQGKMFLQKQNWENVWTIQVSERWNPSSSGEYSLSLIIVLEWMTLIVFAAR